MGERTTPGGLFDLPPYDEAGAANFVASRLRCDLADAKKAILDVEDSQLLLRSGEGRDLAATASISILPDIATVYERQKTNTTCGVASFAMALRFMGSRDMDEASALNKIDELHSNATSVVSSDTILKSGLTFPQLHAIATSVCDQRGIEVQAIRVKSGKDTLKVVEEALQRGVPLCNYDMASAGQGRWWGGHWAPIVAVDEKSERLLVLDGWLYTDPFWVECDQLAQATAGVDADSGEPRGFLLLLHPSASPGTA